MLVPLATNVPAGTADVLSYTMLVVVAIFLISGPSIVYYYRKRLRRERVSATPAT